MGTVDAIIGPDANLWVVTGVGVVYKFDTTAHTTTTYTVTGATNLISLASDGTYVYACDFVATSGSFPMVYRITTSGTSSVFYSAASGDNGGSLYFDGTDIWVTSHNTFLQLNTSGGVVNSYAAPSNHGGGLVNTGSYWVSGTSTSATSGVSISPVGSPGSWTTYTTGITANQQTFPTTIAGGVVWFGNLDTGVRSIVPSTGAVTTYVPSGLTSPQSNQVAYDTTSLWVTFGLGGIWQTTPGSPTVGTDYALPAETILFNAPTSTIWATGTNAANVGFVYSAYIPTMKIVGII